MKRMNHSSNVDTNKTEALAGLAKADHFVSITVREMSHDQASMQIVNGITNEDIALKIVETLREQADEIERLTKEYQRKYYEEN